MQIVAHRGLNKPHNKYSESSWQAFNVCLKKGWGIEFDVNFTKDNRIVIWHDDDLARLTKSRDNRKIEEMTAVNFKKNKITSSRLCDLSEVLSLIIKNKVSLSTLHLKGKWQNKKYLNILIGELTKNKAVLNKILIFDLKPESAKYLKKYLPGIQLSASVAHPFDVKRFNKFTDGTLLTVKQIITYSELYNWVWLDEWDRISQTGEKIFYNQKTFKSLRKYNFKIALVTPELHQEIHQDARTKIVWKKRIKQIIELKPDLICTDFPGYFK